MVSEAHASAQVCLSGHIRCGAAWHQHSPESGAAAEASEHESCCSIIPTSSCKLQMPSLGAFDLPSLVCCHPPPPPPAYPPLCAHAQLWHARQQPSLCSTTPQRQEPLCLCLWGHVPPPHTHTYTGPQSQFMHRQTPPPPTHTPHTLSLHM